MMNVKAKGGSPLGVLLLGHMPIPVTIFYIALIFLLFGGQKFYDYLH